MTKIKEWFRFYEQVKQEAAKVSWPAKSELLTLTYVVLLSVFVFSLVFLLFDYGIHLMINALLHLGN